MHIIHLHLHKHTHQNYCPTPFTLLYNVHLLIHTFTLTYTQPALLCTWPHWSQLTVQCAPKPLVLQSHGYQWATGGWCLYTYLYIWLRPHHNQGSRCSYLQIAWSLSPWMPLHIISQSCGCLLNPITTRCLKVQVLISPKAMKLFTHYWCLYNISPSKLSNSHIPISHNHAKNVRRKWH